MEAVWGVVGLRGMRGGVGGMGEGGERKGEGMGGGEWVVGDLGWGIGGLGEWICGVDLRRRGWV